MSLLDHKIKATHKPGVSDDVSALQHTTPKLSLRFVIGALSALTVIIVASATFAITYTQSLTSVDDAGRQYSLAIVSGSQIQLTAYFDTPSRMGLGIQRLLRQSWNRLPSEDPLEFDVLNRTVQYMMVAGAYNQQLMKGFGFIYKDGSGGFISLLDETLMTVSVNHCPNLVGPKPCLTRQYNLSTATMQQVGPSSVFASGDSLISALPQALQTLQFIPAFWNNALYFYTANQYLYAFPPLFAISNASTTLGLLTMPVYLDMLTTFLHNLTTTKNSHTFILDNLDTVIATTYPIDYTVFKPSAQATQINCAQDASGNTVTTVTTLPCRPFAASYPWKPLADAVTDTNILKPPAGKLFVKIITSGDTRYFVASAGVSNTMQLFQLSVVLLMPDTDILGDIYAARNTVLIIVAVILVVCSAASFLSTSMLLKPLHKVSLQMHHTSRLRDVIDDGELSAFAEIHHLQRAYQTMNTAIKNFTRYVPRDVVKDLMSTGQLCEISMSTMYCSMLFVDIAGFTNMCERVPADELSKLVRSYFETMSTVIMTQGGLIDKFIGDAIMAVWGAPFFVSNHEVKATLAAFLIDRSSQTEPLASAFDAAGEQLSVRVGVATGHVLAGNMGSEDRMNYTVIGDAVNLAAREESMNKQFGTRVMIEERTASCAAPFFVLRKLMRVAVVGKAEPTTVYEVVGLRAHRDAEAMEALRAADQRMTGDSVSIASGFSGVSATSSADPHLRETLTTTQMLDAALLRSGTIVEAERVVECDAFTAAVNALEQQDFSGCLGALKRLEEKGSVYGLDMASEQLRRVAHEGLSAPRGSHDGVMRATEK